MTEILRDEEKVTGTAAKIEDSFAESAIQARSRTRRRFTAIHFLKVEILSQPLPGSRAVTFAQRFELSWDRRR